MSEEPAALDELPGVQPAVVLRLGWRGVGRHRVRSSITVFVIALAALAVISSTGRTEATRRSLLARLEDPAARLIRIVDTDGTAHLSGAQVGAIERLGSVAWVIGLSPAGPIGRNPALGDARRGFAAEAVGTRHYWGELSGGGLLTLATGRNPAPGEAIAGDSAAAVLHMRDQLGTVEDEDLGPIAVVGTIRAEGPLANLEAYVLIRAGADEAALTEIAILARTSGDVERLAAVLPSLIQSEGPLVVARASELLAIRDALATEVGALDQAILFGSLASSAVLVATLLYGAIEDRRREFGLRRSQGASRATIVNMVMTESIILATLGSSAGGVAGVIVVFIQSSNPPDLLLAASVCALVAICAVAGAILPAVVAAIREPLYVLRSE